MDRQLWHGTILTQLRLMWCACSEICRELYYATVYEVPIGMDGYHPDFGHIPDRSMEDHHPEEAADISASLEPLPPMEYPPSDSDAGEDLDNYVFPARGDHPMREDLVPFLRLRRPDVASSSNH